MEGRKMEQEKKRKRADYKYINAYNARVYDRISLFLPKGARSKIKEAAVLEGVSINEFIKSYLPKTFTEPAIRYEGGTDE